MSYTKKFVSNSAMINKIFKKIKAVHNVFIEKYYNIISIKPCYKIVDKLASNSVIVDFGTGNDADFSVSLIKKYNLNSFGFDPTKKHFNQLKDLEKKTEGKFKFFNYALASQKGKKVFFESKKNMSGSFFDSHVNMKNDTIEKYEIDPITIDEVFTLFNIQKIDLLKIDIEGEEYNIISEIESNLFSKIDQIIVEFHHHCIDDYCYKDTLRCVNILKSYGYRAYSKDKINFLFFKRANA